jgi:glycosyltransferase involved in cell wall biosynthesis/4-amino-4-deoxy-L-arabinose transferase-like glycosyltransferase
MSKVEPRTHLFMLSYEREFCDAASSASARLAKLIGDIPTTVFVLSRVDGDTERRDASLCVRAMTGSSIRRVWRIKQALIKEIRAARKRGEAPIITAQDPFIAGSIAYTVSRLLNVPYEVQEHADYFSGYWEKELWSNRLLRLLGRFVLRHADVVRVVSERVKENVMRVCNINEDRASVIPVAQDLSNIECRMLNVESNRVSCIVVPCRFVTQKGLDVLLDALQMLKEQACLFQLRLIGEGSLRSSLEQWIVEKKLSENVVIESWAPSHELWKNADLFVMSSRYEGWGRTITEAMAAQVPIVTTNVGCVGSFFRPQVDGRVVEPNDAVALAAAIREQLTEKERRNWMVANAAQRIKELPTGEKLMEKQREVWNRMSNGTPPTSSLLHSTFLLLAFASIIRIASIVLFWHSLGPNREWGFYTLVEHWFQGYGYSFATQLGCASAYRSPGFLFFLTGVYFLFGVGNFLAQAIIQNILAVIVVYLVYRLGWAVTKNRRVGLVAGFLIALHPYTFYHYTQYYHTVLSSLFLVGLLLGLVRLEQTRRMGYAWITGVLIACLAYVQGTILPAMVLLSLWLLVRWRKEWLRAIGAIAIMAITSAVLIAPWTYRNWTVFHRFVPLTTDTGLGLAKANNENIYEATVLGFPQEAMVDEAATDANHPLQMKFVMRPEVAEALRTHGGIQPSPIFDEWHPQEPTRRSAMCVELSSVDEPTFNDHWTQIAMSWIREHYWEEGWKLQLLKASTFWSPALQPSIKYGAAWSFGNEGVIASLARWGLIVYVGLMELLAIASVLIMIKRKRFGVIAPFLIVALVYTLLHTFFAGYTKYRIPLDNMMVIIASIPVVMAWDWFRAKK